MASIGQLISGRYRLVEEIGHGGMATIYRARDTQLDRDVAVKALHAHLGEDRVFVRRFAAEARRAASVSDEHVIAIYDVATGEDSPAIVMELAAGDLRRLIAEEAPLPPARAARIAADVACGLRAAHLVRLVHRDVKPANILLTASGDVRVADFGIARAAGDESLTATGTALGSVDYFSPEQARGGRATARSDVYALGVVLFELLTGRRPFQGDSPYAVAVDRLNRPPPDPRTVRPDLPPGIAAITLRAMAIEPAARFGSSTAMRKALLDWLASSEAEALAPATAPDVRAPTPPAAGIPHEPARAPERRSLIPLLLALVVLAAVGFLGGRIIDWGPSPGPTAPLAMDSAFAVLLPTATPSDSATTSPSTSPSPTADSTQAPVTPTPTVGATPAPTAVQAAARPAELDPGETVAAWYGYVASGDFDSAYALWSARMRADYERQGNLDGRWDDTASVTFHDLYIAEQTATTAKVQVDLTETKDSGATHRFVGWWDLVLVDGRWLLDHPNF